MALQRLAVDGDSDAMVNYAVELRRHGHQDKAQEWLVRAGDAGHPRAIDMLAAEQLKVADDPEHAPQSLHWVQLAALRGNRDCMLVMARAYRSGRWGFAQDYTQMLRWLLRAAAARSAEAMRLVSEAYTQGWGIPHNAARALLWLRRAAAAGDRTALARLAGQDVERDPHSYFLWARQGAEAGDPAHMFRLALAYRDGDGTEPDQAAFFNWVNQAAQRGHTPALFVLALAYRDGTGVKPDAAEYRRLLIRAADAGDPGALNNLALLYLHGTGVPVDARKHVALLTRAAEGEEPGAMFNLAHAYRDGAGVERNEEQSLMWLRKSAQLGQPDALIELAVHHYRLALRRAQALGSEPAERDAHFEKLATRAAEAGDARGMYLLAMAYRRGIGVPADAARAHEWIAHAAEAGLAAAMIDRARFYLDTPGLEPDPRRYFHWIWRAAGAGDVTAKRLLALAYHDGHGTERDPERCRSGLETAAAEGDREAFVLLGLLELEGQGELEPSLLQVAVEPFMGLLAEVDRIKSTHLVREAPEGVAHFTTPEVLRTLLSDDAEGRANNRLRLYNSAYLRDAQDGRWLFELPGAAGAALLSGFFPDRNSRDWPLTVAWDDREYSVYVGCLNLRADYLDLWRTQGADGAGVCVVTPLAAFAQDYEQLPFMLARRAGMATPGQRPATYAVPPALYRVEYDPAAAAAALQAMQPHLEAIQAFKATLKTGGAVVDALVRILVSEVLYLFKPEAYRGEHETRLIAAFDIGSGYVHRDTGKEPGRLFVETEPFLFATPGSRILVGPAVKERAAMYLDLRFRLAKSRWAAATRVSYSAVEYR